MTKIKSFFVGLLLLIVVFIMVVLIALIYRANERSSIKTYIFQTENYASERLGNLQDIDTISADDLRNKLIKKYVSEYFKVIPGDEDVTNRLILKSLSDLNVFKQWVNDEAVKISEMSQKNMFRMVRINDNGIAPLDKTNQTKSDGELYYIVRYTTLTWSEPNIMKIDPIQEENSVVLGIVFEPGLRSKTNNRKDINIRQYLQEGKSPAGLFKFNVKNVITKDM